MNKLLVVLYPYKFNNFIDKLLEIDEFRKFINVEIWDLRSITGKQDSKNSYHQYDTEINLIPIKSKLNFITNVIKLRHKSNNAVDVYILNELDYREPSQLLCNMILGFILRKSKVQAVELTNGGMPYWYESTDTLNRRSEKSFFQKIYTLFSEYSTQYVVKTILEYLAGSLGKLSPSITTHTLAAGSQSQSIARDCGRTVKMVMGHTQDYSNTLLDQIELKPKHVAANAFKDVIYLDQGWPAFPIDPGFGKFNPLTKNIWYPALNRFFNSLEKSQNTRIRIAGHYKSNYEPQDQHFEMREVLYGNTKSLIRNCRFVIACYSTSISYAVIFRKPIIFIYTDEYQFDPHLMRHIFGLAAILGCNPINIDHFSDSISDYLKVDEDKYKYYERTVLTSGVSRRPNAQIILEDVMGIDTEQEYVNLK